MWLTPHDFSRDLVLKPPQVLVYAGGHHPRPCPKKQNLLYQCLKRKKNTLGLSPPLFGTGGSLILDISIAFYSITIFSISFIYFTLQVKPRPETIPRAPPPQQTARNTRNISSPRSTSPSVQKWGYEKIMAIDSTVANSGLFLIFVLLFLD